MLSETIYIVCRGCGAWTWDVRSFNFPVTSFSWNEMEPHWKLRHLDCLRQRSGGLKKGPLFYLVAESDEQILSLDPRRYEDATLSGEQLPQEEEAECLDR